MIQLCPMSLLLLVFVELFHVCLSSRHHHDTVKKPVEQHHTEYGSNNRGCDTRMRDVPVFIHTTGPGCSDISYKYSQTNACCSETRAFLEYLKDNEYDHRQRPDTDSSTQITVSIAIGSIRKVSEITMVG
jgi:hypothetical protein